MRLLDRLLRYEAIGGEGCPTPYLHRWTLLGLGDGLRVYLHHIVSNDWARDPHDHPKKFWSIGLAGEYWEEVYGRADTGCAGLAVMVKHWTAPWFRSFDPVHVHRIRVTPQLPELPRRLKRGAWTICITGRTVREWGFWKRTHSPVFPWRVATEFIPWKKFVYGGDGADSKDC